MLGRIGKLERRMPPKPMVTAIQSERRPELFCVTVDDTGYRVPPGEREWLRLEELQRKFKGHQILAFRIVRDVASHQHG